MIIISAILTLNLFSMFSNQFHDSTDWEIKPSLKYDMLCYINIMTEDSFYVNYYKEDAEKYYSEFKPTPEVIQASKDLKRKIKDENQGIVSALLCLYFSAVGDE